MAITCRAMPDASSAALGSEKPMLHLIPLGAEGIRGREPGSDWSPGAHHCSPRSPTTFPRRQAARAVRSIARGLLVGPVGFPSPGNLSAPRQVPVLFRVSLARPGAGALHRIG